MLAGGSDLLYREALAGSHRAICRLEVWREGVRIDDFGDLPGDDGYAGVPYLGGNVQATLRSRVTRNLNLTVHEDMVPALDDEDGLLTPYGNYLRVVRGLELGNGLIYAWPVFFGQIRTTQDSGEGTIEIEASDLAQQVDDAKFINPRQSQPGASVRSQMIELLTDAVPGATVEVALELFGQTVPPLMWEYDRARGLDELATAVGAFWWALPTGPFTIRPVPWATFSTPTVTLREADGLPHERLVYRSNGSVTNDNVINSVTAYGERLDGSEPAWGSATNTNPDSPTRADGPIGRRHKLLRLQTPTNEQVAQGAAQEYLKRGAALIEEWSWNQVVDPAMELGEVVNFGPKRRRTPVTQVVQSFNMPLNVAADMRVSARAMVVGLDDQDA